MVGAERLRNLPRIGKLGRTGNVKADRIGGDGFSHMAAHQRHDGRGIQPARKIGPERRVRTQSQAHRFVEFFAEGRHCFIEIGHVRRDARKRRGEIAAGPDAGAIDGHERARRHLGDPAKEGGRSRDIAIGEKLAQRILVEPVIHTGKIAQGLDLGGEGVKALAAGHEERLLTEGIARREQPACLGVPQQEGEHAVQP